MTDPVVTDDGVVERVARAIHADRQEWVKPQYRQPWETATAADEALALSHARAALAASDRDVLLDLLREAALQLEYLDGRFGTGTTPAVLAKIRVALLPLAGEV